jgi:riboflavin synthase
LKDFLIMFTGLVQDVGSVIDVVKQGDSLRLVACTSLPKDRLELGASVACNGVCLTVVNWHDVPATGETLVEFDVGPESLRLSTLGQLKKGSPLNMEPALRMGDALGGHMVSGHVDGLARVHSFEEWEAGFWKLVLEIPARFAPFVIEKGSLTVQGVSLTVAKTWAWEKSSVSGALGCEIMLVPHSLAHTTLGKCMPEMQIEIELDTQVKTIASLLQNMIPQMLPGFLKATAPHS